MGSINSEEIISILKTEIENYDMVSGEQEVGSVIWVGDGIATIYGIEHAMYGEIVIFENGIRGMVQDIRRDQIGCIILGKDTEIKEGTKGFELFAEALHEVNETLAKKMAGDGEGATALFEVTVRGADTKEQAKTLAKSVVCSNLTKAAIAGHDANWGRILCAMGYSGAEFDPEKVDLYFKSSAGELKIIENGVALDYSEEKATEILSMPEVTAIADLGQGEETATAWGCDLTHGYIDINADYRS